MTRISGLPKRAMDLGLSHRVVLVAAQPRHPVLLRVARHLDVPIVYPIATPRATMDTSGAREIKFDVSRRRLKDATAFLVTTCRPGPEFINADMFQAADIALALGEVGVANVILFMLHWPYGRQDRKSKVREPISSAMVAQFFDSLQQWQKFVAVDGRLVGTGKRPIISRMIVLDPHTSPQGFTTIPVEVISSYAVLGNHLWRILKADPHKVAVLSPDEHRLKPARRFARVLLQDPADLDQRVFGAVKIREEEYRLPPTLIPQLGDLEAITIFDDMVDTGGTISLAARALIAAGFPAEKIWLAAAHPLMSSPAKERLEALGLGGMVFTNSTNISKQALPARARQVDLSPLITETIRRTHLGESLKKVELYV